MMKQVKFRIPFRVLALLFGLFLSVGTFAQQITVKGHVKDAAGEAIIGATIRIAGQQSGTASDFDGNFSLSVNKGTNLTISYVGYTSKTVAAAPNLMITLQDDQKVLDNVVVIGYGRAKKSDLTGSVTAIKPDAINHGLQTNAQDMIQGKIAGVSIINDGGTPGGGATIRVRGGSSLNASNDPLIVIDGLAMDSYGVQGLANPLSMVNPSDIESFTVLKDASATAIYGSRASNGVIIITTKKGRSGQAPKVSYNGNISIATKKKTMDVMNGEQYRQFIENLYGKDSKAYKALGWYDIKETGSTKTYDKDGNFTGYAGTYELGEQHFADTDWQNEILRTAVSTDHNVTIAGGLKNMPYRVSLGYTNNQGIVKTSKFERYTASVNLSPSFLNDHLKFNINGKGMIAKSRYADGGAIGAARYMDPTKPVTVTGNDIYTKYFGGYAQWYTTGSAYKDATWLQTNNRNATSNPVSLLDLKDDEATSKSFVGNIEVDYAIQGFEDLHIHANGGADYSTGKQTTTISPYSVSNNYYGYDGWNKKDTYNLSFNAYLQYMKDFAKIHHIDAMAGYEWQHFHVKTNYNGYGMYPSTSEVTTEIKNADGSSKNPKEYQNLAGTKYNEPTTETMYKSENYLVSFFGRLNYSLMDRYLLTFTLRGDGSSRFASGHRWGTFPSAAFAWKMKEESFLKNIQAISDAKLRLGWGITGQQEGIGDYGYIETYKPNADHAYYNIGLNNGVTYRPDATNNELTWEKTTTYNVGLDLSFLNDRLTFGLDWYYRKTKDLINTVYVSAGSTFRNKLTSNIGSLHNTGFEFSAIARPIQTKDLKWEINYNFTFNKNRIDELVSGSGDNYYVETGGISAGTGGNIQAHAVGHAASSFYVYQQAYDKNGKIIPNTYVDRNGNGYIDSGDRYFYYKPAADVLMGFGSKVTYKNWDFSFSMRASLGNYVYNDNLAGSLNVGSGAIYSLGYLSNRPTAAVALGLTNPLTEQYFSDYFVQNASFLKMDNITLGYSFDGLFRGAKYKGIEGRIYATVQNVFTITKYDGLDPEVSSGIDNSLYPRPFTTVLGLSLNF
jgi:iron complex outermembrane receptor protein